MILANLKTKGRRFIDKIYTYSELDEHKEREYYLYKKTIQYNGIELDHLAPTLQRRFNYLNGWKDDEYVFCYDDSCVVEPTQGWCINSANQYLLPSIPSSYRKRDYGSTWGVVTPPSRISHKIQRHPTLSFDSAISLNYLSRFGTNYFAFVSCVLGQLWVLENGGVDLSLPVIVPSRIFRCNFFQNAIASIDRLSEINWVEHSNEIIKLKRVYCSKSLNYTSGHLSDFYNWLNIDIPKKEKNDFIFLTRAPGRNRYITKVDEVYEELLSRGFQIIDTDSLSFVDQIQCFRDTRRLISLHGAGLVNMIFRYPERMSVFEIFSTDWMNGGYFLMSHHFNYSYDAYLSGPLSNGAMNLDLHNFCLRLDSWMEGDV